LFEESNPQIETVEVLGAMSRVSKHMISQANVEAEKIKEMIRKELYFKLTEEFMKYLNENINEKFHCQFALFGVTTEIIDVDEEALKKGDTSALYFGQGEMEYRLRAKIGRVYRGG
jgi:hypothetical protein